MAEEAHRQSAPKCLQYPRSTFFPVYSGNQACADASLAARFIRFTLGGNDFFDLLMVHSAPSLDGTTPSVIRYPMDVVVVRGSTETNRGGQLEASQACLRSFVIQIPTIKYVRFSIRWNGQVRERISRIVSGRVVISEHVGAKQHVMPRHNTKAQLGQFSIW